VVGMAATPDDKGYWLVGSRGSVYVYGDAVPVGSPNAASLAAPIVAVVSDAG